jgi:hypothetical protein
MEKSDGPIDFFFFAVQQHMPSHIHPHERDFGLLNLQTCVFALFRTGCGRWINIHRFP